MVWNFAAKAANGNQSDAHSYSGRMRPKFFSSIRCIRVIRSYIKLKIKLFV